MESMEQLLIAVAQVLEQTDEEACKHAPESPMVLFKRIRMLVALQRIDVSGTPLRLPLPHFLRTPRSTTYGLPVLHNPGTFIRLRIVWA
jgi:hypothetical protein